MRLPLAASHLLPAARRFADLPVRQFADSPLRRFAASPICRLTDLPACVQRMPAVGHRHATPPMLERLISKLASRYFLARAALAGLIRQLWQVRRTVIKPSIDRPGL